MKNLMRINHNDIHIMKVYKQLLTTFNMPQTIRTGN